ncbi:MAG TPA: heme exporter protein CcmD [Chromatiaceae bacterium]|nr:MAG: heme exporter protein CcmD [Thiohalocapsa sp. PB-PSB1]HBG93949.1 heme exporter protein CcmD [Chromatiaceae bacterium]HCS92140.1 heme exporter protein CcmD [Chromatiaceae bacterium]
MIESGIEFFRQGGYAFYVWSAFGLTFVLLIAETLQLRQNRRTILSRIGRLVQLRNSHTGMADIPSTRVNASDDSAARQPAADSANRSGKQSPRA